METARLELRLPSDVKGLISQAASCLGVTLTAFAASTLAERAQRVIEAHTMLRLSRRDFATFVAALEAPPEPDKRLKQAFEGHGGGGGQ